MSTAQGPDSGPDDGLGMPQIDDTSAIRDAATVIVVRDRDSDTPKVLMGQRGASAAFMPNKFVFPGGAVDAGDASIPLAAPIPAPCHARLNQDPLRQTGHTAPSHALCIAAIRELWEETGLLLGTPADWPSPTSAAVPPDWQDFAATGHLPSASAMRFVFRALTPPGRPRRFDARFFVVDAGEIIGDLDDFSRACDELSLLQWIPLSAVRQFDLPFITEVVLAEVAANLARTTPPPSVPFFRNDDEESLFLRLYGTPPPA